MRDEDYGRCPQCGSRTWIEETTWHWMYERWEFTTPNEKGGRQLAQDGSCDCTYHCASCGWTIPEENEGGGRSSWDEYWFGDEDQEEDTVEDEDENG